MDQGCANLPQAVAFARFKVDRVAIKPVFPKQAKALIRVEIIPRLRIE